MTVEIAQAGTASLGYGSHQRKIWRTANGNIWVAIYDGGTNEMWYSANDGTTWQQDATSVPAAADELLAFAIDADDYAHIMSKDGANYIYYRGTPNAGRTSWSWSSGFTVGAVGNHEPPSLVAHKEGTGWKVHILWSRYYSTGQSELTYERLNITSGGTISLDESVQIWEFNNPTAGENAYGVIDFNHTGDCKTVAGAVPHLYVAWSQPDEGGEIKFKKATYSSGTWSWGTTRSLHTNRALLKLISGQFDGSRFVVGVVDTANTDVVKIFERDAADTTTTARTAPNSSTLNASYQGMSISCDTAGDIHIWACAQNSSEVQKVERITYDRSEDSWGSWVSVASGSSTAGGQTTSLSSKPGSSGSLIEAAWSDFDASSPYAVNYESFSINTAPTAPTITSPTDGEVKDVAVALPVVWTFNDPDAGDTQSAYSLRKQIGTASYSYWNGSVWTATEDASTKISSSGTTHTISSSWGADGDANHKYAVKTWDAADAGPSDWDEVYIIPSAKDNPTVTAITTVTAPTYDVTWTVATQTKYQLKVYADSGGSPVTSTVYYNSGIQVSAVTSHSTPFPDNSVTRHVGVTTWNDEGLQSTEDTEQLAVSYPVPPTPTVSMSTTGSESGVIWVAVNNPTPGGGETVTDSNEIYRRVAAEGGDGIRVGQGVAEDGGFNDYGPLSEVVYQYRARAINAGLGTAAFGAWTT